MVRMADERVSRMTDRAGRPGGAATTGAARAAARGRAQRRFDPRDAE